MKHASKKKVAFFIGFFALLSFLYPLTEVHAYWSLNKNGNLIQRNNLTGQVLGDEDKKEEEKKKEEKNEEKQKGEDKKEEKNNDQSTESQNKSSNQTDSSSTESKKNENDTEIKSEEIERVEIHKIETDNEEETEIKASDEGKMEIKIKRNDQSELKEKQESFEMEMENGDKVHIELSPEKTQMEIKKNGVSASVDLPLSINPTLKKLMVSTPQGDMIIESLPDEIINDLKRDKLIDEQSNVQLEVKYEDGQIIYKIEEKKHKKFVGIIPVDLIKNLSVADGTGTILSEQESFVTKLLSLLSF